MFINITATRLEELLKAAYLDGLDDGACEAYVKGTDKVWKESVTADQLDALKQRVRDGGQP